MKPVGKDPNEWNHPYWLILLTTKLIIRDDRSRDHRFAIGFYSFMNMKLLNRFPILRWITALIVVLFLAIFFTILTFAYQGSEQINAGNLCGINQDEPCFVSISKAGLPFPYFVDVLGTSAMGVLGPEDFRINSFLLDVLFFILLLSGTGWLLTRIIKTSFEHDHNRLPR